MMASKGNRRPYTGADIQQIESLAEQGKSRAEIASISGRTHGSINGICFYRGIHTHGGRTPHEPDRLDEIIRLRKAGITQQKIAFALGLSFDTVHSLCARHGIRKRRVDHA